jgi:hypothetical protein
MQFSGINVTSGNCGIPQNLCVHRVYDSIFEEYFCLQASVFLVQQQQRQTYEFTSDACYSITVCTSKQKHESQNTELDQLHENKTGTVMKNEQLLILEYF